MNKALFLTCLILLGKVSTISAKVSIFPSKDPPSPIPQPRLNKTELRSAAFFPASHRFKKIYGDVGLSLQAEAARTLKDQQYLEIWENLEWIFMHGNAHPHSCGKTSIDILNISVGLKTIGTVISDWLYLYAGIGPDVGIAFIENDMKCFSKKIKHHNSYVGIGIIGKSGAQIYLKPNVYLSVFADYLYLPISMQKTVDVGGFKVGGGLGARF